MNKKTITNRELITFNKLFMSIGTIIFMLLFSLLFFTIISISNTIQTEQDKSELILEKKISIDGAALSIQETLSFIADDLQMLSEFMLSKPLADCTGNTRIEAERMFLKMAMITQKYDQIRFIDAEGMEQVRVNYNYGNPETVSVDDLQNKSNRYYFSDSIHLEKGQVYVSVLDLNIEHGEIETPYKPMIRFATPVIDESGNLYGVVVLNYLAEHVLDLFRQMFPETSTEGSTVMMLNSDGYFFVNEEHPELEFGFMFPDKQDTSIDFIDDSIRSHIMITESGSFSENGFQYVFSHFHPLEENWVSSRDNLQIQSLPLSHDEYYWIILSKMSDSYFKHTILPGTALGIAIAVVLIVVLLIISFFLSYYRELRRIDLHNTRAFARYDLMTKVVKREYGLNKLESLFNLKKHEHDTFAMLFLDLNKFKPLNDTYGHKAGDYCLAAVGNRINSNIRDADIAIRLGGDEFLIVIEQLDTSKALLEIAKRIKDEITKPMSFDGLSFSVGVSIGIACFPTDGKTIDELITFADNAMYEAKQSDDGIVSSCKK